jgi:hypothetical protein
LNPDGVGAGESYVWLVARRAADGGAGLVKAGEDEVGIVDGQEEADAPAV